MGDINGVNGAGASNFEIFVDNNSGGNLAHSMHASLSLLLRTSAVGGTVPLIPGNRIVVNVPGNVYQQDNAGNQFGDMLVVISLPVGTETSFLQLRVSSGAYVVISDLLIEYQSENNTASLPSCTVDTDFWEDPPPAVEE